MIKLAVGQIPLPNEEWMRYAVQMGCEGAILHVPPLPAENGYWEESDLVALREGVESWGLELVSIENTQWPMYIECMIGGPRRDEQIESYRKTITNMGRAGIKTLGFCWMPNLVWPTYFPPIGRGGANVRTFDLSDLDSVESSYDEDIPEDQMWENFERFITAVIPAAEESGVRLALHPDDPPVPSIGGVARIFRNFEAFRRATEDICPSPNFGLNFCMGSWSEMGPNVALEAMRYFAERGRIFYLHFRDVKGHIPHFEECFLGEGNLDPAEAIRILLDTGFDGYMEDDHVPSMFGDDTPWAPRGRAWSAGYIRGLLDGLAPR